MTDRREQIVLGLMPALIQLGAKPLNQHPARVIPIMVKTAFDIADAIIAETAERKSLPCG